MEPKWLTSARSYIGQREIPGQDSNQWILGLWAIVPWIWLTVRRKDDSLLPWCGAFVRLCLSEAGLTPPKAWYRAMAYAEYGTNVGRPVLGAIGVIKNGKQWHVGFVLGKDNAGNIIMLGGNQNDSVKLSAFKPELFKAYRWPAGATEQVPMAGLLPILSAALSTSEA